MLASFLGLMVVVSAMGLFSAIRMSSARSEDTYERRMELALTQEAIERSMRALIMSSSAVPRPAIPDVIDYLARKEQNERWKVFNNSQNKSQSAKPAGVDAPEPPPKSF